MIVYQTDANGFFVGAVEADRSPLEADVFLIPAGCIATPPPAFDVETSIPRWYGYWRIVAKPVEVEPETPGSEIDPLTALEYLSALRRQVEEQGVMLHNGVKVKSDVESQGKIAQTIQSIDLGLIEEPVNWKAETGFVQLTRADLIEVGRAVARHVQRGFDAEMAAAEEIAEDASHEQVEAAFTAALSALPTVRPSSS